MARNKHPEETVAKILDVSMRLFTEQGYEHTTIQDIVDALGMSKGPSTTTSSPRRISWTGSTTATTKTWSGSPTPPSSPAGTAWKNCATPSATFSPTRPSGR